MVEISKQTQPMVVSRLRIFLALPLQRNRAEHHHIEKEVHRVAQQLQVYLPKVPTRMKMMLQCCTVDSYTSVRGSMTGR